MPDSTRLWCGPLVMLAATAILANGLSAGEVRMKSGFVLRGTPVEMAGLNPTTERQNNRGPIAQTPLWMVDDGVRRFFVGYRQVERPVERGGQLLQYESFELDHVARSRDLTPASIGAFLSKTEFDEFGRRVGTLATERGPVHIHEGITRLRPDYVKVESTSHRWEYGLDTPTIPADILEKMLDRASDTDDHRDRKARVVFFLQAEMYRQAREEVAALRRDFPEDAAWADETDRRIVQFVALRAMNELERRQAAGQHATAYQFAKSQFPIDRVGPEAHEAAMEIVADYEQALSRRDRILFLLGMLEASVSDELIPRVRAMRAAVRDELHYENLERLDPFLRAEDDETLTAEQKLALAYSGWLLGSANALVDLKEAIRLWDARFLVLEYLRTDNRSLRTSLHTDLKEIEGVSIERIAALVGNLPLPLEAPPLEPGSVATIDVPTADGETPVRYSIQLPPEYSPQHRYPLLIVLHAEGRTPDYEVAWWGGSADQPGWAQRRGYIVVAPHYAEEKQGKYDYNVNVHDRVLESLCDVRKRFRIDSDRVFLAGHGMGADACFDIGFSHPHVFAGVVPINGFSDRYCNYYFENGPDLAWYVVNGERDRNALEENARELNHMMRHGVDVVYCEYKSRGYETYYEELERIFDWMELHRRATFVREWESEILRHTDADMYWIVPHELPDKLREPIVWDQPRRRIRTMQMEGKATVGNAVYIRHPGRSTTIWLSPELVDFDERVKVSVNGRVKFVGFLQPSIEALLDDLRVRGDREQLYWVRLDY